MKVLELLCEPISNGGQEAFVMNVYNNIDMTDLQIDLFTPYYCDNDYYKKQVKARGGKVYAKGLEFNPGGFKFNIIAPIRAIIRKNKYDVVHIHTGSVLSMACAAFAAKLEHVKKIIVHSHSTADGHNIKRDMIKIICTPVINRCATDFFACSKEAGKWKFSRRICENKLKIIINGVNLKKYEFNKDIRNKQREKFKIDKNEILLGHVGRFSEEKNQIFLIELFNKYKKELEGFKLMLIGSGDTFSSIKDKVHEYGLKDKVTFVGNVDNVNDYLQAFDVFLLPSIHEAFPVVLVEAQASGLPCLVSNNISQDVKVIENVCFLDIKNFYEWIKKIKNIKLTERQSCLNEMYNMGYDISNTSNLLRNEYIK